VVAPGVGPSKPPAPPGGCHGTAYLPTSFVPTVVTAGRQLVPPVVLPGGRLPGGPDRIVPRGRAASKAKERVFEIWRDRFFDAFVAEVGQRGLAEIEVTRVCMLAGVPVKTFYKVFEGGKTTCAVQAFRCGSDIVCRSAEIAFARTTGPWEVRLHAAVSTILDLLSSNPNFARLGIVEIPRDPDGWPDFISEGAQFVKGAPEAPLSVSAARWSLRSE
jgi:hypothetical protein